MWQSGWTGRRIFTFLSVNALHALVYLKYSSVKYRRMEVGTHLLLVIIIVLFSSSDTYMILLIFQDISVENTLLLLLCRHCTRRCKSPVVTNKKDNVPSSKTTAFQS